MKKTLSDFKGNIDQYFKDQFEEIGEGSSNGRRLFIAKNAKRQFNELLKRKDKSFSERYFYNQILSIKNVGYLNSQFSVISPITRRLRLEGGEIIYAVWHGSSYVTQINVTPNNSDKINPGVYAVRKQTGKGKEVWEADTNSELNHIQTKNLAINGYANGIQNAANFMPDLIKYGFGEIAIRDVYSLFYNPCSGNLSGEWRSFRDNNGFSTQTAKKLADILALTAEKEKELNLTVHEDGHILLKSALRIVAKEGKSLENFTVFYANPTVNLQLIDRWRSKTGMKLASKAPLINIMSARQYLTSLNFFSDAIVTRRADPANVGIPVYNAIQTAITTAGIATASATFLGISAAAVGAAPFLLGQSRTLSQKVIDSSGKSVQEGVRHYAGKAKKLVWDPIHKMMVAE